MTDTTAITGIQPDKKEYPKLGDRIDRYQIAGVLGAGGMGMVYDAVHTFTHDHVALKVLHARRHAPRMVAEARTLAAIDHPRWWTMTEGTAEALRWWYEHRGKPAGDETFEDHARSFRGALAWSLPQLLTRPHHHLRDPLPSDRTPLLTE